MQTLFDDHEKVLGVKPEIIGLKWEDPDELADKIVEAINTGVPYSEFSELTDEEIKDFKEGNLVF